MNPLMNLISNLREAERSLAQAMLIAEQMQDKERAEKYQVVDCPKCGKCNRDCDNCSFCGTKPIY